MPRKLRTRLLPLLLVVALPSSSRAVDKTVVLTGGGVFAPAQVTTSTGGSTTTIGPLTGSQFQLGLELGNHWTNRFSALLSVAGGHVSATGDVGVTGGATVALVGAGYQLTYDLFGKRNSRLSPYLGAGFWVAQSTIGVSASAGTFFDAETGTVTTVVFEAVGGVHYTLPSGLGFCAEVHYSTYGGFFGTLVPQLGVTYRLP